MVEKVEIVNLAISKFAPTIFGILQEIDYK